MFFFCGTSSLALIILHFHHRVLKWDWSWHSSHQHLSRPLAFPSSCWRSIGTSKECVYCFILKSTLGWDEILKLPFSIANQGTIKFSVFNISLSKSLKYLKSEKTHLLVLHNIFCTRSVNRTMCTWQCTLVHTLNSKFLFNKLFYWSVIHKDTWLKLLSLTVIQRYVC